MREMRSLYDIIHGYEDHIEAGERLVGFNGQTLIDKEDYYKEAIMEILIDIRDVLENQRLQRKADLENAKKQREKIAKFVLSKDKEKTKPVGPKITIEK